ncbi:MAG: methyltransferase domain-containing protein [Burkholderiales bacterium]|nr:methyltransferase domain-containing protein [Burkholderiales bacterium]
MRTTPSSKALEAIHAASNKILVSDENGEFADYSFYHSERLALDYEWFVETVKKTSSVLEIGGYPFFLTSALKDRGYEIQTIDKLSLSATRLANQLGLQITGCDIETEKLPFADDSFDEVIFNEVFEHLRIDPIFTMEEIHRVLKPSGRLWLSTPNLKSLRGIMNFLFKSEAWAIVGDGVYAQYKHLRTQGWMGHVREYTSKEVTDFLRSVGFKIEGVIYRGRYKNPAVHFASSLVRSFKPYFSIVAKK